MPLHNPLDNGKSYAGSFEISYGVESLEYTEQLVAISHVEPRAVVFDIVRVSSRVFAQAADLDRRCLGTPGELDGIRQQVHQYLAYHGPVASRGGEWPERAFDLA